jgi:pilus assembly protein CpaB
MGRKWSRSSRVFGALAVVFGLAAFLVVRGYAERVRALAPALGRPVAVVVAARDLPRATRLTPDMVATATYPSRFVPPGAVRSPAAALDRVLVAGLAEGEVVTRTRLAPAQAGPIAALVPEGLRAALVPVEIPAGSVRPGDRVDLLATFATGQRHTETVAESLEVLLVIGATDASSGIADTGAGQGTRTLVLLVSPDQAESIAYVRAVAQVSVVIDGAEAG